MLCPTAWTVDLGGERHTAKTSSALWSVMCVMGNWVNPLYWYYQSPGCSEFAWSLMLRILTASDSMFFKCHRWQKLHHLSKWCCANFLIFMVPGNLRLATNYNDKFKKNMLDLATAIDSSYGQPYARATQYLRVSWLRLSWEKSQTCLWNNSETATPRTCIWGFGCKQVLDGVWTRSIALARGSPWQEDRIACLQFAPKHCRCSGSCNAFESYLCRY